MRENTTAAVTAAEKRIAQTAKEEVRRLGQIGNTMAAAGEAAGMATKTASREIRLRTEAARRRVEPGYRKPDQKRLLRPKYSHRHCLWHSLRVCLSPRVHQSLAAVVVSPKDSGDSTQPVKSVFVNKELHAEVKAAAKRKFKIYPSAYANAWMVREYKKRGGKFRNDGLDKWFKQKWVRMSSSGRILGPCGDRSEGEGKPKCLKPPRPCRYSPNAAAWSKKRREDPRKERSGAPVMVSSKADTWAAGLRHRGRQKVQQEGARPQNRPHPHRALRRQGVQDRSWHRQR